MARLNTCSRLRSSGQSLVLLLLAAPSLAFIPSFFKAPAATSTAASRWVAGQGPLVSTGTAVAPVGKPQQVARSRVVMSARPSSNQMSQESYTEAAWDTIMRLPVLATMYETQYVEPELLLKSLLEDGPSSLANRILFKAGASVSKVEEELDSYLSQQPRVSDTSDKVKPPTCGLG